MMRETFMVDNRRPTVSRTFILIFLVIATGFLPAESAPAEVSPQETQADLQRFSFFSRPDPVGTPTPVGIGIIMVDLSAIDDVEQTFRADFFLVIRWHDPRLAQTGGAPVRFFDFDEIWHPFIELTNKRELAARQPDRLQVDRSGNVQYLQRYDGTLTTPLKLKDFPFDAQELKITLMSSRYGPEEIVLNTNQGVFSKLGDFSLTGWEAHPGQWRIDTYPITALNRTVVRIEFPLSARRLLRFYSLKIIIPLLLIIFMAWSVFWIDPSLIATQIGIATASVFSLILFNHRVAGMLPRISYITRIDILLLGGTIIVFVALGETVLTSRLAKTGREDLGRRIDRWARWVYLTIVVLLLGWVFLT
jgi:hypothetical protein